MKNKESWEYYRNELITLARNFHKVGVIYPIHGSFKKAISVNRQLKCVELHYGLSGDEHATKYNVVYTWSPELYKMFNGYSKCKFGERLHP